MSTTRLLSAAMLLTMMLQGVKTQGGNVALRVDGVAMTIGFVLRYLWKIFLSLFIARQYNYAGASTFQQIISNLELFYLLDCSW